LAFFLGYNLAQIIGQFFPEKNSPNGKKYRPIWSPCLLFRGLKRLQSKKEEKEKKGLTGDHSSNEW
jgi:hypothetical protein